MDTPNQVVIRLVRPPQAVDLVVLEQQPHLGAACSKCADWGGLNDKVVAIETGIDAGLWTRIKQGQANPSGDFMERLMDAAGNEAPLIWQLLRRRYDPASLRKLESEMQRQLRASEERASRVERELEVIKKFLKDTRS